MSPSYLRPFLPSATLFQNQEIICRDGRDNRFPFFFPEANANHRERKSVEKRQRREKGGARVARRK